jgi:hypothetical protein
MNPAFNWQSREMHYLLRVIYSKSAQYNVPDDLCAKMLTCGFRRTVGAPEVKAPI